LERLRFISNIDLKGATLHVGCGVTTQEVHEACRPFGLTWPIDLASKGSSQIGGNIATNAGGTRVIRYGCTRNWVLGLTAVTMEGKILEFGTPVEKDNTGFALQQLLIGSEGTLAVITEATLKLARLPQHKTVLFLSIANMVCALEILISARKQPE